MKTENIKFKAKELGTGKWKEGFLQRDMDYNLCILIAKKGGCKLNCVKACS